MNLKIITLVVAFIILTSLQFTLNKILKEIKDIKKILLNKPINREER